MTARHPAPDLFAALRREDELHLWTVPLAAPGDEEALLAELAPEERERAARFRLPELRRSFLLGRSGLRRIVGGYLGLAPGGVPLTTGEGGKPALAVAGRSPLAFNLSHSGDLALLAVTAREAVGVDLEKLAREVDWPAVARRYFDRREQEWLARRPQAARQGAFLQLWTLREALLKGLGGGLAASGRHTFAALPEEEGGGVRLLSADPELEPWRLRFLPVPPGYLAALALPGPPARVRTFTLA